eukprot:TRINITY_DN2706_c4_g1_i4.p1 TRINITY_DN2706_c4_g1~~TRINITY_DN2706_c4_g1_i4.p1  ORF type:complete len:433 (+),score=106.49 TRINITY_DN2706_c4_g1_i4:3-1301(+)
MSSSSSANPDDDDEDILDDEDLLARVEAEGLADEDELIAATTDLEDQVKKMKKRMGLLTAEEEKEDEDDEEVHTYPLLDIPDDQLNDTQRREKRKQRFLKNMRDGRVAQKKRKLVDAEKKQAALKAEEDKRLANPAQYLEELRSKRKSLLDKRDQRVKMKAQLQATSSGSRRTVDRQRLRMLTQLEGEAQSKRKKVDVEDNFGARDEDWQVYLAVTGDSAQDDEDDDEAQIIQLEELLTKHDPEFAAEQQQQQQMNKDNSNSNVINLTNVGTDGASSSSTYVPTARDYQIFLGVERIRVPEIVYQPPMVGVEQMGLTEMIMHTLARYSKEVQDEMSQNVYCTGGNVGFPGFQKRLENELMAIRPFQSVLRVQVARDDPMLDAWRGMSKWSSECNETFKKVSVTRQEYDEMGGHYIKKYFASNEPLPATPSTN